jgi:hypothetical protein
LQQTNRLVFVGNKEMHCIHALLLIYLPPSAPLSFSNYSAAKPSTITLLFG